MYSSDNVEEKTAKKVIKTEGKTWFCLSPFILLEILIHSFILQAAPRSWCQIVFALVRVFILHLLARPYPFWKFSTQNSIGGRMRDVNEAEPYDG